MPPIIFLHVPKTAGTTLHSIVGLNYPNHQIFFTSPDAKRPFAEVEKLSKTERQHIRLYTGHFAFGLHRLLDQDAPYITVLREPIDRSLSEYYHVRRDPAHGLYSHIHSGEFDLAGYFDWLYRTYNDNIQTRLFAGEWRNGDEPVRCSDKMLERAKHHLSRHFAVVGMTEQFDETLLLLHRVFGWKHLLYKNRNTTANRPSSATLTAEERAVLNRHNQYDAQLYTFAKELFAEQVVEYGRSFQNDLQSLRARQTTPLATLNRRLAQLAVSTQNVLHKIKPQRSG